MSNDQPKFPEKKWLDPRYDAYRSGKHEGYNEAIEDCKKAFSDWIDDKNKREVIVLKQLLAQSEKASDEK